MAFVPEGQADSSQARSAWVAMQRGPRPGGTAEVMVSREWHEDKHVLDVFLPRSRGCRIQPRVSTLGNIQEKRFALKGREITWPKASDCYRKGNRVFVRQRYNRPLAKRMRTTTKWSNCGPNINIFFASVSYTSDLAPLASPGWAVPRVETLIFIYTQFGETADTWKASLDGANNTGWRPMLHCFPECRAISRGHPGAIFANPRQPRDGVK